MIGSKRKPPTWLQQARAGDFDSPAPEAAAAPQIGLGSAPLTMPVEPVEIGMTNLGQPLPEVKAPGFLSKIGDALKAPGVSAALLRSAGATLNGGLGAGIQAGASFMDRRRADDQSQRMAALEYGLKQRLAANTELATRQTGAYQNGQLANNAEGNEIRLYGINTGAQTAMRGQDIGEQGNIRNNQTSMRNTDVSAGTSRLNNRDTVTATYAGQDASERNNIRTNGTTMFGRPPTTTTAVRTKAAPAVSGWFGNPDTPAVPESTTTTAVQEFPPVPARNQLQAGKVYQTANGPARWDGKQFVQ